MGPDGDKGTGRRGDQATGRWGDRVEGRRGDRARGPVHHQLVRFLGLSGGKSSVLSRGPLHVSRCSQSLD
ncbi:hypothetical protein BC826DRAFT_1059034 [Russula brevipes]|nr:hypothetical protein BC826DRAFT_1059034 [Russula brevipes]